MRDLVRCRIRELSIADRTTADERVCASIQLLEEFAAAEQVLAYYALGDEVSLKLLLRKAGALGKRIYLPAIARAGSLVFARWTPGDSLRTSVLGVCEPTSSEPPRAVRSVCLIPGRAYDPARNRLGRGGGFYDRAMAGLERMGVTIGIAYSCQIFDAVPVDDGDQRVGLVVTDREVYRADAR